MHDESLSIPILSSASCGLGEEPNPEDNSTCSACEMGFYSDSEGGDLCSECAVSKTTISTSSDDVTDCYGKLEVYCRSF